jgi:putative ABC transport system permease protein
MSQMRQWASRIGGLFRRHRDGDLEDELQFHLDMTEQQLRRSGMSDADARREARRRMGGTTQVIEAYRDQRGLPFAETVLQDLRYGLRTLWHAPGFTTAAVITLALGIGATTAIFTIINALIVRPLPLHEPHALVWLRETNPARKITQFSVSYANYVDWRDRSQSWEALAASGNRSVNLIARGNPERLRAQFMTSNLIPMLRLNVALGRAFVPEEDDPGRSNVVILSNELWRRAFGGDPNVLGRPVTIDGKPHTIVGVAPAAFGMSGSTDLFLPLGPFAQNERSRHELDVVGRLKAGVTREQAASEMAVLARQIEKEHPDDNAGWSVGLIPLAEVIVDRDTRGMLFLLFGASGLVLLVACANFSSLLLVRASTRVRELAIRSAIGGGRGRLVRQFVTETLLLSVLGGGAGVLVANWGVYLVAAVAPTNLPRAAEISVDGRVWLFAGLIAVVTGVAASLLPAVHASRLDIVRGLKEATLSAVSGRRSLRSALIVAQLAISVVLLSASGLMLRTIDRLYTMPLGFNAANMITLQVEPTRDAAAFFTTLRERILALPGVQAVGVTSGAPMNTFNTSLHVFPSGPALIPQTESIQSDWRIVDAEYFRTMEIPILTGRSFTPGDNEHAQKVVVLNETLAKMLWGEGDPIGKRVSPGGGDDYSTVVGVVGDVRSHTPAVAPSPAYYMSAYNGIWGPMTVMIRTSGPANAIASSVRSEVRALDPTLPVFEIKSMEELLRERVTPQRTVTGLLVSFAGVALVLAAVGVYGVMAFAARQRTREVGVRLALGAQRLDVLAPLMRDGAVLIVAGTALGLMLALATTQFMRGLLTDVRPGDPLTLTAATLVLAVVSLVACYVPARRALNVHPLAVLRSE